MILRFNHGQDNCWFYDEYERIHYQNVEVKVITHVSNHPIDTPELFSVEWKDKDKNDVVEIYLEDLDSKLIIAPTGQWMLDIINSHLDDTHQAIGSLARHWSGFRAKVATTKVADECCEYELECSDKATTEKIEGIYLPAYIIWARKQSGHMDMFLLVCSQEPERNEAYLMNNNGNTIDVIR